MSEPRVRGRAETLATLAALTAALPVNAALTLAALARRRPAPAVAAEPRTVLITGGKMTKALQLARSFHRAGHRVVLCESAKYRLTGHRFSRAVDAFHVVPEPDADGYADALAAIVARERVDVFVPVSSPLASAYDAAAGERLDCDVVHGDAATVRMLDDKFAFSRAAAELGLEVPDAHRITAAGQVAGAADGGRTYVLKSIPYDPVRRLDLTELPRPTRAQTDAFAAALPISEDRPWILQELVRGQEYCTHSTVRDGEVRLHACCESSASQLNYAWAEKPEIEAWVRRFVAGHKLTGQVSFDFIQTADGTVLPIECNPRTHSAITMFHDHPGVAAAYLEPSGETVTPRPGSRPTYWLYEELWRLVTGRGDWRTILRGKDAIFAFDDPLPFLLVHHLQIPWLLLGNLLAGRGWVRIDFNIGKLVEPGGD